MSDVLARGLALHQAGRVAEAARHYREVLTRMPDHPDALHLSGVAAHQLGDAAGAEALLRRAVAQAPGAAAFHNSLGNVLRERGDAAGAIACYRAALKVQPNEAAFLHHLAIALADRGETREAEAAWRRAMRLRRDWPAPRIDLATLLVREGRAREAEQCLRPALVAAPDHAPALNALGLALAAQGRHSDALAAFDRALAKAPDYAIARTNRAAALESLDRLEEAEADYAAGPADAANWLALGKIRLRLKRGAEAEAALRAALAAMPGDVPALVALGGALGLQNRAAEALEVFRDITRRAPDDPVGWYKMGLTLRDMARFAESCAALREAARLAPDEPEYRSTYAYALLTLGDFAAGWPEFAWRVKKPGNARLREPEWDGQPTAKRVLIHGEQGLGDTIQFARFVPAAMRRAPVAFAAARALKGLLASLPGAPVIYDADPLPEYDVQAPVMSLPHLLGVPPEAFASDVPYLFADDAKVADWRGCLAGVTRPRVGIVWAGNPDYPADRRRSAPFEAVRPLLRVGGAGFVSLQLGAARAALADVPVLDAAERLVDFTDTAAAIMALDLVIAVDTAVAHLAGALGQPVWLLNRADTDWRWLTERSDSPWYPSMRIFRQAAPGDWDSVMRDVAAALAAWRA